MMSVSGQIAAVDRVAARHPALKLVIDHMGLRSGTKGIEAFAGLSELCGLARHANVAVKASALPCYSVEPYPFADVHAHIRRVYDSFGPRRMFWGTDWTRLPCPWRQAVTLFTEELPWLSSHDKEWIMGRGLCEWLDWPMARAA
jgi:predicted TIM-barrel fold metal-dependent hydrolase